MTLCYKVFPAHKYISFCVMWYGFTLFFDHYSALATNSIADVVGGLLHRCVRPPNLLPVGGLEELIFVTGSIEGLATNWWYMLVFRGLLGISEAAFGPGKCFRNLFSGDGSNRENRHPPLSLFLLPTRSIHTPTPRYPGIELIPPGTRSALWSLHLRRSLSNCLCWLPRLWHHFYPFPHRSLAPPLHPRGVPVNDCRRSGLLHRSRFTG